jgi:AcrR family transcriptional regulator
MTVPTPAEPPAASGTRRYHSPRRTEQAEQTRTAILAAAHDLLVTEGYARTTVQGIADRAHVNIDTVYRAVGRKADVVRAVVESAISGTPHTVPAAEREYVQRIRAAGTAGEMLDIYATAITAILQRLAPVVTALRDAAGTDEASSDLWHEISERRAANMRDLAAELRATGELRAELDDDTVADIIWSTNSPEYWNLLVAQRGWAPERFRTHLADAWRRMLLL